MDKRYRTVASIIAMLSLAGAAHGESTDTSAHEQRLQQQETNPYSDQSDSTASRADAATAKAADDPWGMSQEQLMLLQRSLQEQGFYEGSVDGMVGPLTRAALRAFQEREGLEATGAWNNSTAQALGITSERQPVSGTEPSSPNARSAGNVQQQVGTEQQVERYKLSAMSPAQVQDLQQRLQELGHYRGEVDGLVGPQTRAALQAFFLAQAQLASQGMLSDAAIAVFNMTPEQIQPVRGEEGQ